MPAPHQDESNAPTHLLTIEEYAALGEPERGYTELLEGRLLMSPSPAPEHGVAVLELGFQIRSRLPDDLKVVPEVDIDLELAPPGRPATSRRPDLIVVEGAEFARRKREGGLLRASGVLVVIEVVSPGSRRTDRITKRTEYADAGIPHYWMVDLDEPVTLVACELTRKFEYRDNGETKGEFRTDAPFPLVIDLTALA